MLDLSKEFRAHLLLAFPTLQCPTEPFVEEIPDKLATLHWRGPNFSTVPREHAFDAMILCLQQAIHYCHYTHFYNLKFVVDIDTDVSEVSVLPQPKASPNDMEAWDATRAVPSDCALHL